jgi:2-methylcitrate dehydratase
MLVHRVRARRSSDDFPRGEHLAAKIAEVAADPDSLADLEAGALDALNIVVDPRVLEMAPVIPPGIFR